MLAKGPIEEFYFAGAREFKIALDAEATAEVSTVFNTQTNEVMVRIQEDANAYVADTLTYITGTTYINGLHPIVAIATNTFDIMVKTFTAETIVTAYSWPGVTFDERWELIGFELHLGDACDQTENLVVTKDAARGSEFDTVLYTKAMDGVTNLIYYFELPLYMQGDDVVFFTWANAGSETYGLSVYARRVA